MPYLLVNNAELSGELLLFDVDGTLVDDEDRYMSLAALRFDAIVKRAGRNAAEKWAPLGGYDYANKKLDMAGAIAKAARREDMALAAAGIYLTGKGWHEARALAEVAYADADAVQMRDYTPKLFPRTEKSLKQLSKAGFKLGIATNGSNKITSELLNILRVKELFDVIVGSEDATNPKPSPDLLLAACKKADISTAKTIYIGDQSVDSEAAKAAGMPVCIIVGKAKVLESAYVRRIPSVADLRAHP